MATGGRDEIVAFYFHCGYSYKLIACFLIALHEVYLSLRQVKRILRRLGLRRRQPFSRIECERAVRALEMELHGSGSLLGYRAIHNRLRLRHRIPISRDHVMRLLSIVSPVDSNARRRHRLTRRVYDNKGPNYVWHIDGMDKLKNFGFAIHGCIDGYSRRLLWLTVGVSNNNPKIIAHHYLECVNRLGGVPRIVRADCGTENVNVAFIQPFLRHNHEDCFAGALSFRYGRSVTNQRIEAWWSQLKKWCTQWWYEFFKRMEQEGLFNGTNVVYIDCLRFAFMELLQKELDRVLLEWNSHLIRRSRSSPNGHPNELYFLPELHGVQDYMLNVDARNIAAVQEYVEGDDPPAPLEFLLFADQFLRHHALEMPTCVGEALELYILLIDELEVE